MDFLRLFSTLNLTNDTNSVVLVVLGLPDLFLGSIVPLLIV